MIDKEEVIYSIERCISHVPDACRDCIYDSLHPYNECVENMLKDVLELLKEPGKEISLPKLYSDTFQCPVCNHELYCYQKYCAYCGKGIDWNDN